MTTKVRRLALVALAAAALSACAPIDKFGNEQKPGMAFAQLGPIRHYQAASKAALKTWCTKYHGYLSGDGFGCAVEWNALLANPDICTEATAPGLSANSARLISVTKFMDAVCNGWTP